MASLLVITGPPGAGKSTVARALAESFERCIERVATRVGHGFTDKAANVKMHHEFTKAEIDARHVMDDPPDGVDAVVAQILEAMNAGALRYRL